jgi:hypothetical protein
MSCEFSRPGFEESDVPHSLSWLEVAL